MGAIGSVRRWIRESLFVVPAVIIVACGTLAVLAVYLDRDRAEQVVRLPLMVLATIDGARTTVTAVAGGTITVAAIVFSITALSTQLAASQYSPRSVKGFFEDRFQQIVIGFTVGTFTYCLVVLAGLGILGTDTVSQIASLSVTLAIVMGVASVVAIVGYIDHSLRRMQIDAVVRRIAETTLESIRRDRRRAGQYDHDNLGGGPPEGEALHVYAKRSGFAVGIDSARIARSLPPGASARVEIRRGEAVITGDRLVTIWVQATPAPRLERQVRNAIRVTRDRSIQADPYFGVRQLVDIALRALSAAINDPTTAVDVVNQLKIPLRELLTTETTGRVISGPDGQRVFLVAVPSTSDLVHSSLAEIRLAGHDHVSVIGALIEVIGDLIIEIEEAAMPERTGALVEEARLAVAVLEGSWIPRPDVERALVAVKRLELDKRP